MSKRDPLITGVAAAITFAVLFTVFALILVADAWFHLELPMPMSADSMALTVGTFLFGLIAVAAAAFVVGFLFTVVNGFLKR
jgi:hypothetical protein